MGNLCSANDPGNDDDEIRPGTQIKEFTQENFQLLVKELVLVAINGYPRALRSTSSKRNELLRHSTGDGAAAVEKVASMSKSFKEEASEFLIGLVPVVGAPTSVLLPLWSQLRRTCLIAGLFGHDLQSEAVQTRVLQLAAGMRAGVSAAGTGIEVGVQALWRAVAGKLKVVPVGTVAKALVDLDGRGQSLITEEFRADAVPVPWEVYVLELDPEPTLRDLSELLKDVGAQTLEQATRAGKAAAARLQSEELHVRARAVAGRAAGAGAAAATTAAGHAQQLAGGLAQQAKTLIGRR